MKKELRDRLEKVMDQTEAHLYSPEETLRVTIDTLQAIRDHILRDYTSRPTGAAALEKAILVVKDYR